MQVLHYKIFLLAKYDRGEQNEFIHFFHFWRNHAFRQKAQYGLWAIWGPLLYLVNPYRRDDLFARRGAFERPLIRGGQNGPFWALLIICILDANDGKRAKDKRIIVNDSFLSHKNFYKIFKWKHSNTFCLNGP